VTHTKCMHTMMRTKYTHRPFFMTHTKYIHMVFYDSKWMRTYTLGKHIPFSVTHTKCIHTMTHTTHTHSLFSMQHTIYIHSVLYDTHWIHTHTLDKDRRSLWHTLDTHVLLWYTLYSESLEKITPDIGIHVLQCEPPNSSMTYTRNTRTTTVHTL